jgi:methionine-rich copper-binding protein CopC
VDWVVDARWVESGKVLTSSGVSAGIDMALGLVARTHGIESARMLASSLEYVWHEDATDDPFAQFARRAQTGAAAAAISLQRAEPAANAALSSAPQYLQLFFDAAPDIARSAVLLQQVGGAGREIPLTGLHSMDNKDLMVSVGQPLAPGEYTVSWSSAPVGGGAQKMGTYRFAVE